MAAFAAVMLLASPGFATESGNVSIELNKAETSGDQCNMYFMLQNKSDRSFQHYKLDLVIFDPAGVISRQLAVETAPLAPGKTIVKAFPVKNVQCADVGRLLLNNVTQCIDGQGEHGDCTAGTDVSSRTEIEFIK